jgi:hypothetical protein
MEAAEIEVVADYGSSSPDGPEAEYRPDTHVALVEAETADDAGDAVTKVLQDRIPGFELHSVSPDG